MAFSFYEVVRVACYRPVSRKIVKFNPGWKQFFNRSSENIVEPLLRDKEMITQTVTLSNYQKAVKYKNGIKFQSWISANQPFRNRALENRPTTWLTSDANDFLNVKAMQEKNLCSSRVIELNFQIVFLSL